MDWMAAFVVRPRRMKPTSVTPPTTNAKATAVTASLCCLMPATTYSALEALVESDGVLVDGLKVWLRVASAPVAPVVSPLVGGGTVVSMPAPSSSRRSSFNSIATSLIDWYLSSGSFARQRRTMRCNSGGADGLRSAIGCAGSYTTMCSDLMTDSPSNGFLPVAASNRMQPNEKMSER